MVKTKAGHKVINSAKARSNNPMQMYIMLVFASYSLYFLPSLSFSTLSPFCFWVFLCCFSLSRLISFFIGAPPSVAVAFSILYLSSSILHALSSYLFIVFFLLSFTMDLHLSFSSALCSVYIYVSLFLCILNFLTFLISRLHVLFTSFLVPHLFISFSAHSTHISSQFLFLF